MGLPNDLLGRVDKVGAFAESPFSRIRWGQKALICNVGGFLVPEQDRCHINHFGCLAKMPGKEFAFIWRYLSEPFHR
jgi:hypothetical protein